MLMKSHLQSMSADGFFCRTIGSFTAEIFVKLKVTKGESNW